MSMTKQLAAIAKFQSLHESGCFILPNPWDAGTSIYLAHLGFQALATTSAGFAFARGLPDSVTAVSRAGMLTHLREFADATELPVNADFQNGYADEPEGVAESVSLCVETGIAGLSIEDNSGRSDEPLYEFDLAVERIKAAREAVDASGRGVVLTARCEAYLVGHPEPFRTSLERLAAYADAGADCLYAPGVTSPREIEAMVKAVTPKPINILVGRPDPELTLSKLTALGVRRISVGGALFRVAWGAFMRAANQIKETGTFASFGDAASYSEIEQLFRAGL
jgi:2-methylisocitrate lyase-like PEP mutase family enzyme